MESKSIPRGIPADRVRKICGIKPGAEITVPALETHAWWWSDLPKIYATRRRLAQCWTSFGDPDLARRLYLETGKDAAGWPFRVPFEVACEFAYAADRSAARWIDTWRRAELMARLRADAKWKPACQDAVLPLLRPAFSEGTRAENMASRGVYFFEADISRPQKELVIDFIAWLKEERAAQKLTGAGDDKSAQRKRGWLQSGTGPNPFRVIELFDAWIYAKKHPGDDQLPNIRKAFREIRSGIR